jgi:ABC-type antimicrobial peptide transport system permease subunit
MIVFVCVCVCEIEREIARKLMCMCVCARALVCFCLCVCVCFICMLSYYTNHMIYTSDRSYPSKHYVSPVDEAEGMLASANGTVGKGRVTVHGMVRRS